MAKYELTVNKAITALKEAKAQNTGVSIEGKIGSQVFRGDGVDFARKLLVAYTSPEQRTQVRGLHEVVDNGRTENHTLTLTSSVPPYDIRIRYSFKSLDADYHGGMFGFFGILKDVGKAILHMRE